MARPIVNIVQDITYGMEDRAKRVFMRAMRNTSLSITYEMFDSISMMLNDEPL